MSRRAWLGLAAAFVASCSSGSQTGSVGTVDSAGPADATVRPTTDAADAVDAAPTSDPGEVDVAPTPDVPSACSPEGFCRPAVMSSCGDPGFWPVFDPTCTTDSGEPGYCCEPGECTTDADCPGCELCDLPAAGPTTCTDVGGTLCAGDDECPEQYCCSFSLFESKPACGGLCIYMGGNADCGPCMTEGVQRTQASDPPCCDGLTAIPAAVHGGDGSCLAPRCTECVACVAGCGDGACTPGEDPCRCPQDCPFSFPGGPGAACTSEADCSTANMCLPETSGYPTGGYCTGGICDPFAAFSGCPAGARCVGTFFSAAYICMATCRGDSDCRPDLTCELYATFEPGDGAYLCWQRDEGAIQGGQALGDPCLADDECISQLCLATPETNQPVCSAWCSEQDKPCKVGQTCLPTTGCAAPPCGGCFGP